MDNDRHFSIFSVERYLDSAGGEFGDEQISFYRLWVGNTLVAEGLSPESVGNKINEHLMKLEYS